MLRLEKVHRAVLLLGLVAFVMLQVLRIADKTNVVHDEGISYLAASGHQELYETSSPRASWCDGKDWKALWSPDGALHFKKIGSGLARYDIHPPLFFWLLHIAIHVFGVHLWVGPALNAVLLSVAYVLIYWLGRQVLASPRAATVAVWIWAFSPQTLVLSSEARQYPLLVVVTLIFAMLLLKHARSHPKVRSGWSVALAVATAAGLLTHYHFVLVIGASLIWLALDTWHSSKRTDLLAPLYSLGVGALVFVAIHPLFLRSFTAQSKQAQAFAWGELLPRLRMVVVSVTGFIVPPYLALISAGVLAVFIPLRIRAIRARKRSPESHPHVSWSALSYVCCVFVFLSGSTAVLYILCMSPRHAMGARYLAFAHPFEIVTLTGLILSSKSRLNKPVLIVLCIWTALYGLERTAANHVLSQRQRHNSFALWDSDAIVLDSARRGVLPRILWHVRDDARVYAANQDSLLTDLGRVIEALPDETAYVSSLSYGNTESQRLEILSELEGNGFTCERVEQSVFGVGQVYLIRRTIARTGQP